MLVDFALNSLPRSEGFADGESRLETRKWLVSVLEITSYVQVEVMRMPADTMGWFPSFMLKP